MPRAKRGFKARRRRNRIFRHAQGFYGARGRIFGDAIEQVHNAWADAYAHRKLRKRDFRRLWITRISAAAKINGISYSKLVNALKRASVQLDRKILADLAVSDPGGFKAVIDAAGGGTAPALRGGAPAR
jgi:large subunit ribosomal protein L20